MLSTKFVWGETPHLLKNLTVCLKYERLNIMVSSWIPDEYDGLNLLPGNQTSMRPVSSHEQVFAGVGIAHTPAGAGLLRIDERYDGDSPTDSIDENDPWRPMNVFVHAPGQIG
ncbi:MAG TPA: hypothetical protein PKH07_11475, partial [bacterium]|nr:hypothetical protein [bacterium]